MSGRTSSRSLRSTSRGSRCTSAAGNARSPGLNRTFSLPSWRSSTDSWWRRARISTSLSRSLIGSRRSSTAGHHAALIDSRATAQTRPTALDIPYTPHTSSDQGG
ncbi:hypothetical protein OHA38_41035 (plasmid) [Streptomyces sp. NBC_01732]|uniref:hypothetical protein n=1 Tax=unclassified Streptomyces TaxID=2593676 RepID=UPI002DD9D8FD|nr:hypothetical protein [Streptomyces sp. NBC_01768]WSC33582.1 hypothetical protein OG902_00090 [Streptomyces sp. NBC_01768]WSC33989.1 hypothetical protein OG902_44300 [Streptomyces sp. NBC_01768]WSG56497.1 hypothetical protein OHA38_41035 [Streptomyces sp. NBC_01732]